MKKFFLLCIFTSMISIISGTFVFNIYKNNIDETIAVMSTNEKVYMLLYGSYNSKDKVNKLSLDNYILENNNNFFEVYVGISKKLENAEKIRGIYKEMGNNIYIREKNIDNIEFINFLDISENNFKEMSSDEIIKLENNIINKYKQIYE